MGERDFIKRAPALPFRRVVGLSFSRNKHLNLKMLYSPFCSLSSSFCSVHSLPLSVWGQKLAQKQVGKFLVIDRAPEAYALFGDDIVGLC